MIEPKQLLAVISTASYTSTPPFDADKYRPYLEDTELSEEQQVAYLRVLWSIMATFVELGFGVDSIQQVLPALEEKDLRTDGPGAKQVSIDE